MSCAKSEIKVNCWTAIREAVLNKFSKNFVKATPFWN